MNSSTPQGTHKSVVERRYFIVWNSDRSEGFVTDEKADAESAVSGRSNRKLGYYSQSTAGAAFHEAYEDDRLVMEEVSIVPRKARSTLSPEGEG
jgi:hypothetical protein